MTNPHEERSIEELLGAYALDAVEDHERDLVDGLLPGNARFRAEIDGHRETIGFLTQATLVPDGAPAPPHVWKGISARLEADPPPLRLVASDQRVRAARPAWATRAMGVFAAAAVIAVAVLGIRVVQQEGRLDDMTAALAGDRLEQAANAAMAAPGSEVVTLVDPAGSAVTARIAVQDDGIGYVVSDSLPALAPDRAYQLWVIVDDTVLSAGLLGADPEISPFQVTGDIAGFAITEEVAEGVVASENDPVALWLRDA